MFLIFGFILIVGFSNDVLSDEIPIATAEECGILFGKHNALGCCEPPLMRSVEIAKQCRAKCVGVKDRCCFNDCFFEIGEVMIDGKFNDEKFRGLYDADMARKSNVDWKNVIESSMETCKKLIPETTQFDSKAEMPCNKSSLMYPRMLSSCIRQLNFVNCPSIDDSDRCKASKEFVANNKLCGSKVGEFFMIFSDFFFIPKIMKKPEKVEMQTKTTLSSSNEQE